MSTLELPGLAGTNPLGFLAALGLLDVLTRHEGREPATLRWTDSLQAHAVVSGTGSVEALVELVDSDLMLWRGSPLLNWGTEGVPLDDVKPSREDAHNWAEDLYGRLADEGRSGADLWCSLLAEGAFAQNGRDSKPTHLHFTAGQQQFLRTVRELARSVDRERVSEAVIGPWRYDSELHNLRWDVRGERLYAISARNPSSDPPRSIPGANWLGFLGLKFFPVAASNGTLRTTACAQQWKSGGSMTWPLWEPPLRAAVISSMLGTLPLSDMKVPWQRALGISSVLQAPIRRTDQGGYGSFGAPTVCFGSR